MGDGILTAVTTATTVPFTGNAVIDPLLIGTRWFNGATTTVTYSFLGANSFYKTNYSPDQEYTNASEMPGAMKAAVRDALAAWARVANIQFVETVETSTQAGDIRFGIFHGMPAAYSAWAYGPGSSPVAGDVWLNATALDRPLDPSSFTFRTILHEIGHALGLKHPFEAEPDNPALMADEWNTDDWTIMSYNRVNGIHSATPHYLDILAIQHLYGPNTTTTAGNDVYALGNADQTIWDHGGIDTVVAQVPGLSYTIDLNANAASTASAIRYFIMPGVVIENATGGALGDGITGNAADNAIAGGGGNDTIAGGAGTDTALFSGAQADYIVAWSGTALVVNDKRAGGDGIDTLLDVELLGFADGIVAATAIPQAPAAMAEATAPSPAELAGPVALVGALPVAEPPA